MASPPQGILSNSRSSHALVQYWEVGLFVTGLLPGGIGEAGLLTPIVMDAGRINLGLVQMTCTDDPAANMAKAEERIEEAAARGAQVACLQELYRSRYFCQAEENPAFDLAEAIPGPTTERLGRVAAAHKVVVIAPIFERRAAGVYHNSAVVIDETGA